MYKRGEIIKIIVTGASGFVGKHLCKALEKDGHNVVGLVRRAGFDITLAHRVLRKFKGNRNADVVIHLAAVFNGGDLFDVNVIGTWNVLRAMEHCGMKKLIFFSTMNVFGEPKYLPVDELHPRDPKNLYGFTKLMCEDMVRLYSKHGINSVILRCSGIYGHGKKGGAVKNFVEEALNNQTIVVDGTEKETWDMVYIDDVVDACRKAIKLDTNFNDFNIGGTKTVMKDLVKKIINLTDSKSAVAFQDGEPSINFYYNVLKAKEMLRFRPISLEQGLKKYIKEVRKNEKHI